MSDKKKKLEENLKGLFSAAKKSVNSSQPSKGEESAVVEETPPEPAPAAAPVRQKQPAASIRKEKNTPTTQEEKPVPPPPSAVPEKRPAPALEKKIPEKESKSITTQPVQSSALAVAESKSEEERKLLVFKLDNVSYAIEVTSVRTTIKPQTVYVLPGTAAHLKGLINLRGEVVPVFDLRTRFSLPEKPADSNTRFIVVELGDYLASLVVDSVVGVETIPSSLFEKPSGIVMSVDNRFLKNIIRYKDQLILNLNLPMTVSGEEPPENVEE